MAGDQLLGLYNSFNFNLPIFTPTYNTTFCDDPLIFDFETHDLVDQFAYYSTINNLNDLQFNYFANNNAYCPSHDSPLLPNPNHMFSFPDDDQFDQFYPPSKRQRISCCNDQFGVCPDFTGYKYNCGPAMNSAHTYSTSATTPHSDQSLLQAIRTSPTPTSTTSCYWSVPLINVEGSGKKAMAPMKEDQGMSAQSVAARQRRRRITEKTRELGELVPGGNKMNTAEMFHSAFKYIKFLQAQVGVLEFMASIDQDGRDGDEQLRVLLASPIIQEKLYSAENCLVPKQFLEISNAKDQREIKTHNLISKERTDHLLVQQTDHEE